MISHSKFTHATAIAAQSSDANQSLICKKKDTPLLKDPVQTLSPWHADLGRIQKPLGGVGPSDLGFIAGAIPVAAAGLSDHGEQRREVELRHLAFPLAHRRQSAPRVAVCALQPAH